MLRSTTTPHAMPIVSRAIDLNDLKPISHPRSG